MLSSNQRNSPEIVPVERLQGGDHACLTFSDDAVRWQALTVHTWAGLAKEQRILIVVDPDDLRDDEIAARFDDGSGRVESAWASGQLQLKRTNSFYCPDGRFDLERQRKTYAEEIAGARQAGWSGLWGAASANWAAQLGWGAGEVADFESSVAPVFADSNFTAICWYDRRRCNDYMVAAARSAHPLQIMERLDALDVVPRSDGPPATTSVALSVHGGLSETLGARLDGLVGRGFSQFELDLTDLSFMEASVAIRLISFAAALPADGRVTVRCGPVLELLLQGLGSDTVTQLHLVVEEEP